MCVHKPVKFTVYATEDRRVNKAISAWSLNGQVKFLKHSVHWFFYEFCNDTGTEALLAYGFVLITCFHCHVGC